MPPKKGHQQKRGLKTRNSILAMARDLFAKQGYKNTSLAEISEAAGLTQPGVLHHFGSKEGVLMAVINEFDEEFRPRWNDMTGDGGIAALEHIPDFLEAAVADPRVMRMSYVLAWESLEPDTPLYGYFCDRYKVARDCLTRIIKIGQRRGEIRPEVNAKDVGMMILAFQDGIIEQWLRVPAVPMGRLYRQFMDGVIRNIVVADREPAAAIS